VNYQSIVRGTALAGLLVVPALGAFAQGTKAADAAAPAAPAKIGVINVRNAIVSTAEGKQASAELQSKFAPRQNDLDTLQKQIEDIRNRLRNGERTLS
jgi:Skp family chaperone for outer membrane proteins